MARERQQHHQEEEPTQQASLESGTQQEEQASSHHLAQQAHVLGQKPREEDPKQKFNDFLFWRVPVPDLDLSDILPPPSPLLHSPTQHHEPCDVSV